VPGVGNIAPRALVNQFGTTYFFSEAGYLSLDDALHSQVSSRLLTQDNAMMRSKRGLSPRMVGACSTAFENYLLVSVPSGDKWNAHTWVADQNPADNLPPSWCGIWTGARPAQWATGRVGGRDRAYFAAYDKTPYADTHIHIWEAFQPGREDEGGAITSQFETGMISFGQPVTFKHADIEIAELLGDANLKVFVGGKRGGWTQIADMDFQAEVGSIGGAYQTEIDTSSTLEAYKPQGRKVSTKAASAGDVGCTPEQGDNTALVDEAFQLLFEWRGRMGIKSAELFVDTNAPKNTQGKCEPSEAGQTNAVNAEGLKITE
jgi:hypothetical protein